LGGAGGVGGGFGAGGAGAMTESFMIVGWSVGGGSSWVNVSTAPMAATSINNPARIAMRNLVPPLRLPSHISEFVTSLMMKPL
jgi:hypothetical protein